MDRTYGRDGSVDAVDPTFDAKSDVAIGGDAKPRDAALAESQADRVDLEAEPAEDSLEAGGATVDVAMPGALDARPDNLVDAFGSNDAMPTQDTSFPASQPAQLAAGTFHTCLRTSDQRVVCWGESYRSLLAPATASLISVNRDSTCGLRTDGTISCSPMDVAVWPQIPPGSFKDLSMGDAQACAVGLDGRIACWGPLFPGGETIPVGEFTRVAVGAFHACALRQDGVAVCWGSNDHGETVAPDTQFTRLAVGAGRSCGIRTDGHVICWGAFSLDAQNVYQTVSVGGQLTCGVTSADTLNCWNVSGEPVTVPAGLFVEVAAGESHACAVRIDGGVTCWGTNESWQIGAPRGPFLRLSATGSPSCAITLDHNLVCWAFDPVNKPGQVQVPTGKFLDVVVRDGYDSACFIREDGAMGCWGRLNPNETVPEGKFRRLAGTCALREDGSVACLKNALAVPSDRFIQIDSDFGSACGVRSDGTIACWDVGLGQPLLPPAGEFISVALAGPEVCGLHQDGTVACTRCEPFANNCSPVPPSAIPPVRFHQLAFISGCFCGLDDGQRLQCWKSAPDDPDCFPPAANDVQLTAIWPNGCVSPTESSLVCNWPYVSIDLDHP
jgi:alpha-tubulin suppressor-like RCC1 family protein